ncbi:MAG: type II toxin-antitoxin system Phd/YefM family antitoxin [Candidatus Eremiobacteraeota bacterium]|nr:type II toxin-antitoxin system Phd/YefM family antitoxin [Candidatus Eremiobacteraeota bacterium]MBV9263536.1 type II toxin-antitoxin system Phd/YefM family antitoxin [Candidatus Eremiobacteraeota bacterium]
MKLTSTIGAAEFKARCLELMNEVARTRKPLTITKRGRPVVRMVPATLEKPKLFGALKGAVVEYTDPLSPTRETWEAEL